MAVTSVKEDWDRQSVSVSTDGADAHRIYTVVFDGADAPELEIMLAIYANDGSTAIPAPWSAHPFNPWFYVGNIIPRRTAPHYYEVDVNYTVASSDRQEESPFMNPLDRNPEVSISFAAFNEQIDKTIDNKPITNSAGQSFDPPPTDDFYDLVINIVRYEDAFNYFTAAAYIGSINSDYWWGFNPGMVKCTRFGGRGMRAAALIYWQVTYEFQVRLANYAGIFYGWKKRILDEGYAEKIVDPDTGEITWKVVKDIDEVTMPQMVLLDGNGEKLGNGVDAKFEEFDTKRKMNFSLLGL